MISDASKSTGYSSRSALKKQSAQRVRLLSTIPQHHVTILSSPTPLQHNSTIVSTCTIVTTPHSAHLITYNIPHITYTIPHSNTSTNQKTRIGTKNQEVM